MLLLVALALLLPACETTTPAPRESRAATTPPGLEYECHPGFPFHPGDLTDAQGSELGTGPRWTALERVFAYSDAERFPRSGWLGVPAIFGPEGFEFVARAGDNFYAVQLERGRGGWDPIAWDRCKPRVALLDDNVVEWALRRGERPTPTARHLEVFLHEGECVSGRDPRPYLNDPEVIYEEERILIVVTAEIEPGGAYECPGNPIVRHAIDLDEPVGDRALLDAGFYPPRPATRELGT